MGNESIVQPSPSQGQAKFKTLFFALLILLVLFPFLIEKSDSGKYIDVALDLILLTAVYVVSTKRSQMIIALCFAIPGLLISGENFYHLLSRGFSMETLAIVGGIFKIGLFLYTSIIILKHVLYTEKVTMDSIFGALCVYLLMALSFGLLYGIFYWLEPASFRFPTESLLPANPTLHPTDAIVPLIYFSFVTISTLGYGDIVPIHMGVRYVCSFEAVIGQLFLVALVARLVGLEVANRTRS